MSKRPVAGGETVSLDDGVMEESPPPQKRSTDEPFPRPIQNQPLSSQYGVVVVTSVAALS